MQKTDALMIDDDETLCKAVSDYLALHHFQLTAAQHPDLGLELLASTRFPLLLLDVMLPDTNGFALCRKIRERPESYGNPGIIMLTARGEVIDRVLGFEMGADDYVPKPFEPRELVARMQAVLRRQQTVTWQAADGLSTPDKGLILHDLAQDAWLDGCRLELTRLEYTLLSLLYSRPGQTFSRDDIMDHLRGMEADVYSRSVDVLVSRLRQKLGDQGKPARFIRTVWARGYAFVEDTSHYD